VQCLDGFWMSDDGTQLGSRVFSMNSDCSRLRQSISAVWLIGDRFGRSLPVCSRHVGKLLESTSHTSNSRNSSKNNVPHTRINAPKLHIQRWRLTACDRETTGRSHTTLTRLNSMMFWDSQTRILDIFWLSEDSSLHSIFIVLQCGFPPQPRLIPLTSFTPTFLSDLAKPLLQPNPTPSLPSVLLVLYVWKLHVIHNTPRYVTLIELRANYVDEVSNFTI